MFRSCGPRRAFSVSRETAAPVAAAFFRPLPLPDARTLRWHQADSRVRWNGTHAISLPRTAAVETPRCHAVRGPVRLRREPERRVAVGHEHEGVRADAVAPAHDAHDEVE